MLLIRCIAHCKRIPSPRESEGIVHDVSTSSVTSSTARQTEARGFKVSPVSPLRVEGTYDSGSESDSDSDSGTPCYSLHEGISLARIGSDWMTASIWFLYMAMCFDIRDAHALLHLQTPTSCPRHQAYTLRR